MEDEILIKKEGNRFVASRGGISSEDSSKKKAIAGLKETEMFIRIVNNSQKDLTSESK